MTLSMGGNEVKKRRGKKETSRPTVLSRFVLAIQLPCCLIVPWSHREDLVLDLQLAYMTVVVAA
jgi:hypothetical protein